MLQRRLCRHWHGQEERGGVGASGLTNTGRELLLSDVRDCRGLVCQSRHSAPCLHGLGWGSRFRGIRYLRFGVGRPSSGQRGALCPEDGHAREPAEWACLEWAVPLGLCVSGGLCDRSGCDLRVPAKRISTVIEPLAGRARRHRGPVVYPFPAGIRSRCKVGPACEDRCQPGCAPQLGASAVSGARRTVVGGQGADHGDIRRDCIRVACLVDPVAWRLAGMPPDRPSRTLASWLKASLR